MCVLPVLLARGPASVLRVNLALSCKQYLIVSDPPPNVLELVVVLHRTHVPSSWMGLGCFSRETVECFFFFSLVNPLKRSLTLFSLHWKRKTVSVLNQQAYKKKEEGNRRKTTEREESTPPANPTPTTSSFVPLCLFLSLSCSPFFQ